MLPKKGAPADPAPRLSRLVLIALGLALFFFGAGLFGIRILYNKTKSGLPSVAQLEKIEPSLITRIYSADDTLLMEFFTERRIWRSFEEIPPQVYNAVISIEDKRFWYHWGMNIYTLPDIFIKAATFKGIRGGSTITQQLARNLYASIGRERTLIRKVKELFTAFQIERTYTKRDILTFYLNQVCMGGGAYGFQAAAQKYFGRNTLSELTLAEAASLASIIQRPEYFRPDIHPENTLRRRNVVLLSMFKDGVISKKEYLDALDRPVLAVRHAERKGKAPYFVEHVRQNLERRYGANILYTGGLTVRTTLNYRYQARAEALAQAWLDTLQRSLDSKFIAELGLVKRFRVSRDTLKAHLGDYALKTEPLFHDVISPTDSVTDSTGARVPKIIRPALHDSLRYRKVQIAFAVLDNKTGAIQALIGGRNFEESEFNRCTQGYRQPGSAFKPFIYTAAIDNGYTPCYTILDQAFSLRDPIQGEWRPENYDREFRGLITLRRALALSVNTVAIKLQQKVGTQTVINYAVNMGLNPSHLAPVPSLAIGSCEAVPLALFSAYSAYPNGGVRAEPYSIDSILNRDGGVREVHHPILHNVLNPRTAYLMTSMLGSVITSGTAFAAWGAGIDFPAGGKTGTTNDYTDAWFVGFTSEITAGVWLGLDVKWSLGQGRTGSYAALPLWTDFMLYVHDSLGLRAPSFAMPGGLESRRICKITYLLAGEKCDSTYDEVFAEGTEPGPCPQDHAVKREFKENRIDPFGTKNQNAPEPGEEKKKKNIFLM